MNKRKKKNKALPLVILVVLLLAMIGAYVFLQSLADETDQGENNEIPSISLSDFTKDKIASITYGNVEEITLVCENGKWYLEGDEKFPLDQTKASKMAESLASISASREVERDDLAEFGLDTPALTVKLTLTTGEEYTYALGDVNSFNDMTYILYSEKIYIFTDTLSANFGYSPDDLMLIKDSFPEEITADSIKSVILRDANGDETVYDSIAHSEIKKCFDFKDVNAYGLTEDDIASLGIKEDGAAVIIKYSTSADTSADAASLEATFKILLGETDGKRVYALKGGDMTFNINSELFDRIFKDSAAETE